MMMTLAVQKEIGDGLKVLKLNVHHLIRELPNEIVHVNGIREGVQVPLALIEDQ